MLSLEEILKAFETFLNSAKSAGALKDFSFSYTGDENILSVAEETIKLLKESLTSEAVETEQVEQKLVEVQNEEIQTIIQNGCETSTQTEEQVLQINTKENEICQKAKQVLKEQNGMNNFTKATEYRLSKDDEERLVQIHVSRKEMNERIERFFTYKRNEIDDWNVKRFCGRCLLHDDIINNLPPDSEDLNSCARVDAVYVAKTSYAVSNKVSISENSYGPGLFSSGTRKQAEITLRSSRMLEDVDERLKNMEQHLKLQPDGNFHRSLYSRLKQVEDRVLFLESLSLDYFQSHEINEIMAHEKPSVERECSYLADKEKRYLHSAVDELLKRKAFLKEELKQKLKKRRCDDSD